MKRKCSNPDCPNYFIPAHNYDTHCQPCKVIQHEELRAQIAERRANRGKLADSHKFTQKDD